MKFCECDYNAPCLPGPRPNIIIGLLCCVKCGLPIECDFSYLSDDPNDPDKDGTPHPAEELHIDYRVCKRHLHIAVDNVASR